MLGVLVAALWRYRTQTVLLFLLGVVAAAGAAAAPGYVVASLRSMAVASASEASAADRVVEASTERDVHDPAGDLTAFAAKVTANVVLPDTTAIASARMVAVLGNEIQTLAYREGVCAHLAIQGSCPAAPGELLLPVDLADRLGIGAGDRIGVRGRTEIPPVPMTVVGRYRALNPAEAYWGRQLDQSQRVAQIGLFTPIASFGLLGTNRATLGLDLVVSPEAYRSSDAASLARTVQLAELRLTGEGIAMGSGLGAVADRLRDEEQLVVTGVIIGVSELLIVAWLALFLAIRRTAQRRRGDLGLLKLRGLRRRDLWLLVVVQTVVPLVVGGVVGGGLGPWAARWLATDHSPVDGLGRLAWSAAAVAVLGAMVVALVAERRAVVASVATLNRRAGLARAGRAALIVDGIVVLLAVAGAYQALAGSAVAVHGVGLLAPLLLALAVGVLAARAVPLLAGRAGTRALHNGRLGAGLTAMHLARRPGAASALGVVVVVVATLLTTGLAWSAAAAAYEERAVAEIGAPRVLTVRAESPERLLAAVRAVDPQARAAMAVVRTDAPAGRVLAVDTTRLAAVAPYLPEYDVGGWDAVVAALRPAGYETVVLPSNALVIDATWSAVGTTTSPAVNLSARVVGPDGATDVALGPLWSQRHTYTADVAACARGCRLVSLTLTSTVDVPAAGSELVVHTVSGVALGVLADRGRWRASVASASQVPEITAGPGGLALRLGRGIAPAGSGLDVSVFVADAPTPLPVVRGGDVAVDRSDPRTAVVGNDVVPVRLAGQGRTLPGIGTGLMVDLEYADRLGAGPLRPTMEVWLGRDAPAGIVADLAAAGVSVLAETSIDGRRDAFDARGPAAALRFLLVIAAVALGLAVLSFALSVVTDLRARGAELSALRQQGLSAAVVRRIGPWGYLVFAAVAVGLGLVTGLLIRAVVPGSVPAWIDGTGAAFTSTVDGGWAVLAVVTVGALLVFGAVAVVAGTGLVATVRRGSGAKGATWSG